MTRTALAYDGLLNAALNYASRGWHVLPLHGIRGGRCTCGQHSCSSGGKHPLTPRGVNDATADAVTIRQWWRRWPNANIGIATGAASSLVVLDLDPRNGGEYTLDCHQDQHGLLPETVESLTGGGGRHLFFRHPGGRVASRAGALGEGLDVKADGGYIVAPPSLHASGRHYCWELSSTPDQVAIAELPEWLLGLLQHQSATGREVDASPAHDVDHIPQGQRNDRLTSLAGSMRRRGMSQEAIRVALLQENAQRCDPPLADQEVTRIAASVARYQPAEDQRASRSTSRDRNGRHTDDLIDLILSSDVELFHDQRGVAYARTLRTGGCRIVALGGKEFESYLAHLAWRTMRWALGHEVFSNARRALTSIACLERDEQELHVRVASKEGASWLDLDGVRAVRVGPDGWQVVSDPPILFRSFSHQQPLPEPVRGGDIREVLRFVNIAEPSVQLLFLCYLVVGLVPAIPVPALVVHGPQGAAKTTLLRVAKRVLDPSAVEVRGGSSSASEYALAASQSHLVLFDNITRTPGWLSDAICRTVTGDGWAKRRLYSDEDLIVVDYRGLVGLAGINLPANRADLLDRSIVLKLAQIARSDRRDETSFWAEFDLARPRILGAMLDALSAAMRIIPEVVPSSMPRMADFARWGTAATLAMGLSAADFEMAYARNVDRQNEAALEANPVADAVLVLMADGREWTGTPTDLFDILTETARRAGIDVRANRWPKAASALKKRLREAETNLLAKGIRFEDGRDAQRRWIALRRVRGEAVTAVTGSSRPNGDLTAERACRSEAVTDRAMASYFDGDNDGDDGDLSDLEAPVHRPRPAQGHRQGLPGIWDAQVANGPDIEQVAPPKIEDEPGDEATI